MPRTSSHTPAYPRQREQRDVGVGERDQAGHDAEGAERDPPAAPGQVAVGDRHHDVDHAVDDPEDAEDQGERHERQQDVPERVEPDDQRQDTQDREQHTGAAALVVAEGDRLDEPEDPGDDELHAHEDGDDDEGLARPHQRQDPGDGADDPEGERPAPAPARAQQDVAHVVDGPCAHPDAPSAPAPARRTAPVSGTRNAPPHPLRVRRRVRPAPGAGPGRPSVRPGRRRCSPSRSTPS